MNDLKNLEEIKKLDPKNVLGSTEMLVAQCEQIIEDTKSFILPDSYKQVKNIVFSGMGGSALGAQVVNHLYKNELSVPFYINNDYSLPGFVNQDSLIILSSYSGTTEETLASAKEALAKNCKITAITTGGELAEMLLSANLPVLKFNPKNNPCGQPRLGTGYAVFSTISLLLKTGLLKIDGNLLLNSISPVTEYNEMIRTEAIRLAQSLKDRIPVIFSGEFLVGTSHVLRNQFNETAKNFSAYSPIPELNHHLLEGLKNPENKNLTVLFLESDLYSEKLKQRIQLTKDVVSKNNIPFLSYKAGSPDKLGQAIEVLSLGGYLTFYLSILYDQDPSLIPWVDYFKQQLKK
jgi:glucose/mannose-6-phosphate isomerase